MQSIHFGFSFGGSMSPFTAEPFVAEKSCVYPGNVTSVTEGYSDITSVNSTSECVESYGETRVQFAFVIAGLVGATSAIPFIVLYCLSKSRNTNITTSLETETLDTEIPVNTEKKPDDDDGKRMVAGLPELSLGRRILFVCLLMVMISAYAGGEGRFSSLITTFVTDYLSMSKVDSLHLASLFWGTFAGGRFLGIIVTRFMKTKTMLLVYILCLILNYTAFLFAAVFVIEELVWACTAIGGLSMSVIFPAIFTWTAESIMPVTGVISSVYIVGVSVFNMLGPLLYGYLMDNFSQMYFAYLVLSQFVVCMVLYVMIRVLVAAYIKPLRHATNKKSVDL